MVEPPSLNFRVFTVKLVSDLGTLRRLILLLSKQLTTNKSTTMTESFRTYRSEQTVQTQIRLLLEEQSDKYLHCLLFHLHHLTKYPKNWPLRLTFRLIRCSKI